MKIKFIYDSLSEKDSFTVDVSSFSFFGSIRISLHFYPSFAPNCCFIIYTPYFYTQDSIFIAEVDSSSDFFRLRSDLKSLRGDI
ncbi:MAG: hypothetical protein PUE12_08885 [Oscillospiraceae bacterium]|nr:hypothetical protein [Oscillospiraceae bacterium]